MRTKEQILATIRALHDTREYADEIESKRLTAEIQRLLVLLEMISAAEGS